MANLKKIVQIGFVVLFTSTMLSSCIFEDYLKGNRPDHLVGKFVVKQPAHGDFYFITQQEHLISSGLWVAMFVIFAVYGLVHLLFGLEE